MHCGGSIVLIDGIRAFDAARRTVKCHRKQIEFYISARRWLPLLRTEVVSAVDIVRLNYG